MRSLALLALLAACGTEPEAPPEPTGAERLVGTWALDPLEAVRWEAWRTALDGETPRDVPAGAEGVATFLREHPDHADAARLRATLATLDGVRLVVTADTLSTTGADGGAPRAWSVLSEADGALRVETRDPANGTTEVLAVSFDREGRLETAPETHPQDKVRWRRVP